MKLSFALSTLALLIPVAVEAAVVPEFDLAARHHSRGRTGFGGFGGGVRGTGKNGQGQQSGQGTGSNKNTGGNSSTSVNVAAATSATSTAAAAAATSSVATGQPIVGAGNAQAAQTSLTLDPAVIMKGLAQNGQETPEAGQVPSLVSTNNFINFCLTVPNLPLTNGQQVTSGSCNQTPMGVIVSTANMPSSKFTFPKNGATIPANQAFTISMAINNLETGNFVNAQQNYYAAPAQVNSNGVLVGHSHVVVEQLDSLDQTTPTNPNKFAFFKGLNNAAVNGVLTADVTAGLPAGSYRLASINTASNHQPALVAVAQHGSLDDQIYFTVSDNGAASNSTSGLGNSNTATVSATVSAATGNSNTATVTATVSAVSATSTSTSAKGSGQGQNNQQGKTGQTQQAGKGQQVSKNGRGNNGRGRREVLARLS